jgi:4-hydroxy-2-oxoglutarate aldolase
MTIRLQGIFPALLTPFRGGLRDEDVDFGAFAGNIGALNATGLAGYVVLGSNGECVSLSWDEALGLVQTARGAAAPGKLVIAGTGQESTRLTIDFTNAAADLGADAALVRPPSYFKSKLTREALKSHYLAVADAARMPVIIYNIPQNTGIAIEPSLVVELASHPNIIGLKESSGSLAYLEEIILRLPPEFSYFVGSGYVVLPALVMGARGAILGVANAAPSHCVRIYELFREGRIAEATALQLDIVPLNKAVMETYGIAGLKHAVGMIGQTGGRIRSPLLPLAADAAAVIARLMNELPKIES